MSEPTLTPAETKRALKRAEEKIIEQRNREQDDKIDLHHRTMFGHDGGEGVYQKVGRLWSLRGGLMRAFWVIISAILIAVTTWAIAMFRGTP